MNLLANPVSFTNVGQSSKKKKKKPQNFLFCIGVQPINDVVIVSGGQQKNSAIHIHESILPQTLLSKGQS